MARAGFHTVGQAYPVRGNTGRDKIQFKAQGGYRHVGAVFNGCVVSFVFRNGRRVLFRGILPRPRLQDMAVVHERDVAQVEWTREGLVIDTEVVVPMLTVGAGHLDQVRIDCGEGPLVNDRGGVYDDLMICRDGDQPIVKTCESRGFSFVVLIAQKIGAGELAGLDGIVGVDDHPIDGDIRAVVNGRIVRGVLLDGGEQLLVGFLAFPGKQNVILGIGGVFEIIDSEVEMVFSTRSVRRTDQICPRFVAGFITVPPACVNVDILPVGPARDIFFDGVVRFVLSGVPVRTDPYDPTVRYLKARVKDHGGNGQGSAVFQQ